MSVFKRIEEIGAVPTERKELPAASVSASPANTTQYFDPKPEKKEEKPAAQPAPTEPKPIIPLMDKERAKKSGKANAYIVGGGIELLFGAIEIIRHSYSFNDAEKAKFIAAQAKDKKDLTPDEISLNRKFLMETEKHMARKDKIKMKDSELETLEYGYSLYAEITGKETNPQVIIYGAVCRAIAGKMLDVFIG